MCIRDRLYTRDEGRFFFNFRFADTALAENSRFRGQNEEQYRSPRLPPFFSASIREQRVTLSVGHSSILGSNLTVLVSSKV